MHGVPTVERAASATSALPALQAAARRDDAGVEEWGALARAYADERREWDAVEATRRALEHAPRTTTWAWLGATLAATLEQPPLLDEFAAHLGPLPNLSESALAKLGRLATRGRHYELALRVGTQMGDTEEGCFRRSVALWELGREERAARELTAAADTGAGRRAAVRFALHRDELAGIEALLAGLGPPDAVLVLDVARALVRRGEGVRALPILVRAEALGLADDPDAREARAAAESQARLVRRTWPRPVPRQRVVPVPGRPLHVVARSLPHHTSGATYRTHYIAKAQRAAGLDPRLVTELGFPWASEAPGAQACDIVDGVPYYRLVDDEPARQAVDERLARTVDALVPLARELSPSVLHPASDWINATVALELRPALGLPVVYEVRGFPEERLVRRAGSRALHDPSVSRRELELECWLEADRIVTLAEVMRDHMVARGVPAEKIRVVPNAVDPAVLKPVTRDAALARRLGLDDAEIVLGYVTTLHGYEGTPLIVEAVAELRRRGRRAKALLVGAGNDRINIERAVRRHGLDDAVVLAGRVPHDRIAAHYGLMDLFVVPRRAEATSELVTPLKPYEAMAMGLTVVASRVRALCEIVTDGQTGRTFTAEDVRDLAAVCEELADDPGERRRLADNGREWVTTQRTWAGNARRYRELYEELGVA